MGVQLKTKWEEVSQGMACRLEYDPTRAYQQPFKKTPNSCLSGRKRPVLFCDFTPALEVTLTLPSNYVTSAFAAVSTGRRNTGGKSFCRRFES